MPYIILYIRTGTSLFYFLSATRTYIQYTHHLFFLEVDFFRGDVTSF